MTLNFDISFSHVRKSISDAVYVYFIMTNIFYSKNFEVFVVPSLIPQLIFTNYIITYQSIDNTLFLKLKIENFYVFCHEKFDAYTKA